MSELTVKDITLYHIVQRGDQLAVLNRRFGNEVKHPDRKKWQEIAVAELNREDISSWSFLWSPTKTAYEEACQFLTKYAGIGSCPSRELQKYNDCLKITSKYKRKHIHAR